VRERERERINKKEKNLFKVFGSESIGTYKSQKKSSKKLRNEKREPTICREILPNRRVEKGTRLIKGKREREREREREEREKE